MRGRETDGDSWGGGGGKRERDNLLISGFYGPGTSQDRRKREGGGVGGRGGRERDH